MTLLLCMEDEDREKKEARGNSHTITCLAPKVYDEDKESGA